MGLTVGREHPEVSNFLLSPFLKEGCSRHLSLSRLGLYPWLCNGNHDRPVIEHVMCGMDWSDGWCAKYFQERITCQVLWESLGMR